MEALQTIFWKAMIYKKMQEFDARGSASLTYVTPVTYVMYVMHEAVLESRLSFL